MPYQELNTASITSLVHEFYAGVRADPELYAVFSPAIGDDWTPHLARMVDFWSTIMMGSKQFQGNVFGKHMLLGGVEPRHFRRWLDLFLSTAERLFEPALAVEFHTIARRMAASLQNGYFGKVIEQ
jgi:hemoglobin